MIKNILRAVALTSLLAVALIMSPAASHAAGNQRVVTEQQFADNAPTASRGAPQAKQYPVKKHGWNIFNPWHNKDGGYIIPKGTVLTAEEVERQDTEVKPRCRVFAKEVLPKNGEMMLSNGVTGFVGGGVGGGGGSGLANAVSSAGHLGVKVGAAYYAGAASGIGIISTIPNMGRERYYMRLYCQALDVSGYEARPPSEAETAPREAEVPEQYRPSAFGGNGSTAPLMPSN